MNPSWELCVQEIAESSFTRANQLFSCISNQNQKSIQEVCLIAQDAVNGFTKLLTLLDGSMQPNCKRIRKGPLPNSSDINPAQFMDSRISMSQNSKCNSNQSHIIGQLMPPTNRVLIPTGGFNLYRENQKLALQHYYSETNPVGSSKLIGVFSHSSQQTNLSKTSSEENHVDKRITHHSSSQILVSRDESSMFSKRKETNGRHVASTGECHCSKQWKLSIRKIARVPAVSNKQPDVPPDDCTWRKYGQKPIKGSPHPRSYYRCIGTSSCPARKRVERCVEDPTMLVVTYAGDHNHMRI